MNRCALAPTAAAVAGFVLGAFSVSDRDAGATAPESAPSLERAAANRESAPAQEAALGVAMSALRANTDLRGLAKLGSALEQLDSTQMRALLDHLERQESSPFGTRLAWLFCWWLKRDPAAATEWIQPRVRAAAQDGPLDESFRMTTTGGLITGWAKADPRAAVEFARRHPRTGLATELLSAAMEAWPERDDARRLALLLDFPAGKARTSSFESVLSTWAKREPDTALAAARALTGDVDREKATAAVLRAWAGRDAARAFAQYRALALADPRLLSDLLAGVASSNPVQAVEWLAELDPVQIARCAPELVEKWAVRDPAAAFTWALAHGVRISLRTDERVQIEHSSLVRAHTRTSTGVNPFQSALEKQPEATLAWLRALPPGAERDRLTEAAVSLTRNVDHALTLFSALPPDAAERAAREVGALFHKDPDRGAEWANSLPAGPVRARAWASVGSIAKKPFPLPPGADRDAMLSGIVLAAPIGTGRSAVSSLENALEIRDPVLRGKIFNAAMERHAHSFPTWAAEVLAWMETADVPEEWKRRWRK